MPGSVPDVHAPPLLIEVATPMPAAPPSKMRPIWAAATIVDPFENVSGSTTVLCWPTTGLLNGSVRIGVCAVAVAVDPEAMTAARTSGRSRMRPPFVLRGDAADYESQRTLTGHKAPVQNPPGR